MPVSQIYKSVNNNLRLFFESLALWKSSRCQEIACLKFLLDNAATCLQLLLQALISILYHSYMNNFKASHHVISCNILYHPGLLMGKEENKIGSSTYSPRFCLLLMRVSYCRGTQSEWDFAHFILLAFRENKEENPFLFCFMLQQYNYVLIF